MKKCVFLALAAMIFAACENQISTRQYEGEWIVVEDDVYSEVVITLDSIIGYNYDTEIVHRNHYTLLGENEILLERCWLNDKNKVDYYCKTYMRNWEDSLAIGDFCGTLIQVYPPQYKEIKLVRK